jgi:hypothetical protein
MKKTSLVMLASAFACISAAAQNPYLPLWEYIPDGEPYLFEDPDNPGKMRVYVYGSHDSLIKEYCGREQVVWSAPEDDLSAWRYDGVIFESKKDAKGNWLYDNRQGDILYAPDMTVRVENGKKVYYLFPNNQARGRKNMIAKSDRPDGPFEVCNWDSANPARTVGVLDFDPAVFVDDDGKVYGYWGFERSYGAELDPNTMATVKPGTEIVADMVSARNQEGVFRFFEASSMRKIKDKYVFVYSRWTDEGEFGLPSTNYTLAYAWSESPLGPFTYGGTIIDGRGRTVNPDGKVIETATPSGNTHGGILEIGGQWYVFYHRQCGTDEFSRQAMVAQISVEVTEGPGGKVVISEGEYTSEGFAINGLDPFGKYSAGIACWYTGPEPARQEYPNFVFSGSYVKPLRTGEDSNPVVNNTNGSVVGYKYFNFDSTYGLKSGLKIALDVLPEGIDGTIDIMVDSPWEACGGKKVGSMRIMKEMPSKMRTVTADVSPLTTLKGKHSIYLVISSEVDAQSVCEIHKVGFVK